MIRPWIVRRACLDRVGPLDEAFRPTEWDEADLAYRIRAAGWSVATCGYERLGAYQHLGSTTIGAPVGAVQGGRPRNGRLFHERWDATSSAATRVARRTWARPMSLAGWTATGIQALRAVPRRLAGRRYDRVRPHSVARPRELTERCGSPPLSQRNAPIGRPARHVWARNGMPWEVHDEIVRIDPRVRHLVPHASENAPCIHSCSVRWRPVMSCWTSAPFSGSTPSWKRAAPVLLVAWSPSSQQRGAPRSRAGILRKRRGGRADYARSRRRRGRPRPRDALRIRSAVSECARGRRRRRRAAPGVE